jgi:hypothetical protein
MEAESMNAPTVNICVHCGELIRRHGFGWIHKHSFPRHVAKPKFPHHKPAASGTPKSSAAVLSFGQVRGGKPEGVSLIHAKASIPLIL